jgi:hypothetical protein
VQSFFTFKLHDKKPDMKSILVFLFVCSFSITSMAQKKDSTSTPNPAKAVMNVEASCGQCQFGLDGKTCDLAVRINGKAYFVDGAHIDQHGDAHAKDGFCNAVRKAQVQGEIVNNRFKATYFKLLPEAPAKAN